HKIQAVYAPFFTEWQNVFNPTTWQLAFQQTCRSLRNDNLLVRCYVVVVCVRNKSERLRVPRIQPQVLLWQINAALVANFNHRRKPTFRFALVPQNVEELCALTPGSKAAFIKLMKFGIAFFA